ncbi:uncharacterized protein msl-2 [Epargyreus clarus]|uniref:uncharacterized protein msl-2 n=1 Tax=Epargyreus clarus TaxID=520877 RepID=UPI003C2F7699
MKMNATSLYVSTCRLIILAEAADKSSWIDLFRLVPYLRQSLSCTVCGNLLKEPYTPTNSGCQHHVCKKCKGGRKKLKPSCGWCNDYESYSENLQLRILLQCYMKLCDYFMGTDVYKTILEQNEVAAGANGGTVASSGLIELIQEGAGFSDNFKSTAGLSKSAYSILPCVYTNSASTQTQGGSSSSDSWSSRDSSTSNRSVSNGSPLYSVMHAGSSNKITIKRKAVDDTDPLKEPCSANSGQVPFKKPTCTRSRYTASGKRKGCRCGNATATPGKLTCCGQRCPCYVESKPCTECKCKGCRNPHRPDGVKVPFIRSPVTVPQLENIRSISSSPESSSSCSSCIEGIDPEKLVIKESLTLYSADLKTANIQVFTSQLKDVSSALPATILMDEDTPTSAGASPSFSSPRDQSTCSPKGTPEHDVDSIHSESTADASSDVEVDV